MVDGLLVAIILLNVYIIALFLLHQRGKLRGPTLELMGPLLMWKTEQGKGLIEKVSKPRRFWKVYGDIGTALTVVSGVGVFAMLLLQLSLLFTRRDILEAAAPSPEYFLVLPGINPLIPLWYGILGLAVALVVHEGAHGVLARVHDIKVKSLGLLFLVVPIGAFVEPDDEELEKARTIEKARVFSAGVMTNLVVAVLAAALFSGVAWASVTTSQDGLAISNVIPGTGAAAAGLQPGMVITAIDGIPVRDLADFNRSLSAHWVNQTHFEAWQARQNEGNGTSANATTPGSAAQGPPPGVDPTATVTTWQGGRVATYEVTLTDKWEYYAANDPAANQEDFRGRGFFGISSIPMSLLGSIRDINAAPLSFGLAGVAFYISEPFPAFGGVGFSPLPPFFEGLYEVQGPLAAVPEPVFWVVTNSLYWVFWLNLMVGTFNALPLGFLDGGQMFKAGLRGFLRRRAGVRREDLVVEKPLGERSVVVRGATEETQHKVDRIDAVVRKTTLAVSLGLVVLILAPIVGPRLL
jgi:membrane-associated protease RseP (regulator of RpoE activity)